MVAKITIPRSIEAALNYNEKKVQKGHAICLHAENYLRDAGHMNFHQKLQGFKMLNELNERAATKTLHVSLNFDISENIPDRTLVDIASVYMKKIGFENQPFLVYKHNDAGHPHIHIVSTTITAKGNRINTHNIGRNQSEKARKEIERLFSLVKAEKLQRSKGEKLEPLEAVKVLYGKNESKRAVSNIVTVVFEKYKFASLQEFNAALKQFNICADKGEEGSRINKNRGLVYRILDAEGRKVGVPIKASLIACKPILKNLEEKFIFNGKAKDNVRLLTKGIVDYCLQRSPDSLKGLTEMLKASGIATILRENTEGRLYGITFVDNKNKCVFNGSDLGKSYSAAALQNRLGSEVKKTDTKTNDGKSHSSQRSLIPHGNKQLQAKTSFDQKQNNLIYILTESQAQFNATPFQLLRKKWKKKNKSK